MNSNDASFSCSKNYGSLTRETRLKVAPNMADQISLNEKRVDRSLIFKIHIQIFSDRLSRFHKMHTAVATANRGPFEGTLKGYYTVRPLFKNYTTLWNIWTYQLLCKKKLHNLFKIVHKLCKIVHKLCNFLTQQLVGSYVSQYCVIFLNSGLTVYVATVTWATTHAHSSCRIGQPSKVFQYWTCTTACIVWDLRTQPVGGNLRVYISWVIIKLVGQTIVIIRFML